MTEAPDPFVEAADMIVLTNVYSFLILWSHQLLFASVEISMTRKTTQILLNCRNVLISLALLEDFIDALVIFTQPVN